jgi:uncharacterized protein (TIGR03435 family)
MLAGVVNLHGLSAQLAAADWEKASGGKMSFDVASVKQNTSSDRGSDSNVPFFGDRYPPNGGLFSAKNYGLSAYIAFAYKFTMPQSRMLNAELPKWAATDRFDVEGRGPADATKDQMRLMMQSLLADRFQLKAHFETRETKVYALELVKPGVTGPKLQPHKDDPPCGDTSAPRTSARGSLITTPSGFPVLCDTPIGFVNSSGASYGGRDITMQMFVESLIIAPNNPPIDRLILDQTGLTGKYDFVVNYSPQWNPTNPSPDDTGPTIFEALKDQLGLKLEATTASVNTLIVDHIEEPSPN